MKEEDVKEDAAAEEEQSSEAETWPQTQTIAEHVAQAFDKPVIEVVMIHRALQATEYGSQRLLKRTRTPRLVRGKGWKRLLKRISMLRRSVIVIQSNRFRLGNRHL